MCARALAERGRERERGVADSLCAGRTGDAWYATIHSENQSLNISSLPKFKFCRDQLPGKQTFCKGMREMLQ